jgi:hypothetical protein
MAAAAVPLATTALGAIQGGEEEKAQARHNRGQAELTRYSDVTGQMGKLKTGARSPLSGAVQGGFSGLSFGAANPDFKLFGGGADAASKLAKPKPQEYNLGGTSPMFDTSIFGSLKK